MVPGILPQIKAPGGLRLMLTAKMILSWSKQHVLQPVLLGSTGTCTACLIAAKASAALCLLAAALAMTLMWQTGFIVMRPDTVQSLDVHDQPCVAFAVTVIAMLKDCYIPLASVIHFVVTKAGIAAEQACKQQHDVA